MSKKSEFSSMDLLSAYNNESPQKELLKLNEITFNPVQPRILNKDKVEDLVDSMRKLGLIEPIIVKKNGSRYTIIAGERRYRAALKLGWQEIPVRIMEVGDDVCYEMALAENEKRKSLNPWEVGKAIQHLRKERKKTASEVADLLGYTERYVKQLSSIARLDQRTVEEFLESGKDPSVKNLENLLRQKEGRGEIVSPQSKFRLVINLSGMTGKKRESFLLELEKLKRKYDLI